MAHDSHALCEMQKRTVSALRLFLGLCLLCGPALALCIGNPLASLGAKYASPLAFAFGLGLSLCCFAFGSLDGNFAGVGQQGANLSQPCDLGVNLGDNGFNSHKSRITQ